MTYNYVITYYISYNYNNTCTINIQKPQMSLIPMHRWMDTLWCTMKYHTWYENNNKHSSADESHRHYVKPKKIDTKEHMLKDSIYMKLRDR